MAERSAHLSVSLGELSLSLLFSTPSSICTIRVGLQQQQQCETGCIDCQLDLHATAVHLDDLGSEGLDGSQDQLLVLKGSDAKAQYVSVDTESKI